MHREERKYKELRRLSQELHLPIPEAFWEIEVRDGSGRVTRRFRQRSHSWVRNAYSLMFGALAGKNLSSSGFGPGYLSLKDTGNVVRYGAGITIGYSALSWDGTDWGLRGPAGEDRWGILVGSGTNPENFEDYALQTKIANGTGAGQLSYVASEAHVITWLPVALTLKNELARYFNNNSGAEVNVNEVALACKGYILGTSAPAYYMLARDLLVATVTVPDTGQLKVTYTVQLAYPA